MAMVQPQDDDLIPVSPPPTSEVVPKRMYLGKLVDIRREIFKPRPEFLKEGESSDPFPQILVSFLLKVPGRKDLFPLLVKLKDQPGRGPRASLSKFQVALENAGKQMRKSQLLGSYWDLLVEDKNPINGTPLNWAAEFFLKADMAQDTSVVTQPTPVQATAPTIEEDPSTEFVPF